MNEALVLYFTIVNQSIRDYKLAPRLKQLPFALQLFLHTFVPLCTYLLEFSVL